MPDVTITFAGMCVLVPDPAGTLHVLMPKTGIHPHEARLGFLDSSGTFQKPKITGMHLELANVSGTLDPAMNADIFDFGTSPHGRRTINETFLNPVPSPGIDPVSTRVRITAGRAGTNPREGGIWNFDVGGVTLPRRLPTATNWVIPGLSIASLEIVDLLSNTKFEAFPGTSGNIEVLMVHVTPAEEMRITHTVVPQPLECPENKIRPPHFMHYKDLLTPSTPLQLPEFNRQATQDEGRCPAQAEAASARDELHADAAAAAAGGSELTCMVTTAPFPP